MDLAKEHRPVEEIRESEEKFRVLANFIPQLAWSAAPDGALTWYNQRWYDYTGTTFEEMRGWGWQKVHDPEHVQRVTERFKQSIATGEPWEDRFPLRGKDGAYRWFLSRAMPIRDASGKITQWIGTNTDITDERQTEAELAQRVHERTQELTRSQQAFFEAQKLEAIGRLSGGVAHDFNNLLTGILGIIEDLRERMGPDSPYRADLDEVITAAHRASALTRQLLAFGRRQVVSQKVLNLNAVIVEMNRMFQRILGEDILVRTALDPRLLPVRADPGHIEQVVMNLILNARDAMPQGGTILLETANIQVTEEMKKSHFDIAPGSYVALTITDSGSGISPDNLSHIFEPFFTTKEQGKGTGLGLATVYGIIKQNNGDISVYSELGKGTTFRIYLPHVAAPGLVERRGPERGIGPGGSERVLIVEDEDIVRRVAVKTLERAGYTVLQARDGDDALRVMAASKEPIDLLLTDIIMPGINGRAVAERLAARQPGLPVLYMSGYPQDIILEKGILDPSIAFIQKSYSAEALRRKVREVLDTAKRNASPSGK